MNVVVDTNVIVAALIQDGIVRKLLAGNPGVFMTPESCVREAWERRSAWNRRNIPDARLSEALAWLAQEVLVVEPQSTFRDREGEASALTPDPDDVPVIALALQVRNEGVWTFNTKDFSRPELLARIRVLTTDDVRSLLAEPR